jgi:general secretion pathway protein G
MNCVKCQAELPTKSVFCPACGARVRPGGHLAPVEMKRPGVITFLAVLHFIGAFFGALMVMAGTYIAVSRDSGALTVVVFFLAITVIHLAVGIGLWKLKSWGRIFQIILSCVGLLAFPLGTLVSALILYYLFRPHVIVLFSEKTPDQLSAPEIESLATANGAGIGLVVALCLVVGVGLVGMVAAIAIPNLLNAIDRAKQKRTVTDIHNIAEAMESYGIDYRRYPQALSVEELEAQLSPAYLREMPKVDGWGQPFVVWCDGTNYLIQSAGKDGVLEKEPLGGPFVEFEKDIVLADGEFVQWPEPFLQSEIP